MNDPVIRGLIRNIFDGENLYRVGGESKSCNNARHCIFKSVLPLSNVWASDKEPFVGKLWWKMRLIALTVLNDHFYYDTRLAILSTRWPKPNSSMTFHEGIKQYHRKSIIRLIEILYIIMWGSISSKHPRLFLSFACLHCQVLHRCALNGSGTCNLGSSLSKGSGYSSGDFGAQIFTAMDFFV